MLTVIALFAFVWSIQGVFLTTFVFIFQEFLILGSPVSQVGLNLYERITLMHLSTSNLSEIRNSPETANGIGHDQNHIIFGV